MPLSSSPSAALAAAQLARLGAERPLQPARVGLPARQLPGGDRAGAGGEHVEQHLGHQRRAAHLGRPVAGSAGAWPGRHQAVELGGQLGVALHDRVDGDLRVEQRGRQADVGDDGDAGRLQRRLLLVVEEAGEQPPVQDLTAVVVGVRRGTGRGHFRSSLPARSRSTAMASAAAFSALAPFLVGRAAGPAAGVDATARFLYGRLDGQRLDAERPGVPAEQPDAGAGRRDRLGGERPGGRDAVGVDGERVPGDGERQRAVVVADGVALEEDGHGDARRVPVERRGRRGRRRRAGRPGRWRTGRRAPPAARGRRSRSGRPRR